MLPETDSSILRTRLQVLLVIIAFMAVLGLLGALDVEDEQAEQDLYCDMVKQHRKDPSTGWPDYRGEFDELCK